MRKPEEPDRKLFWLMILLGLVCTGFGAVFGWVPYSIAREEQDLRRWVDGTAALTEIGIRTTRERHGSGYHLQVRYQLRVDGRTYDGVGVFGGSSGSGVEVRSLILPYAPEAAS